MIRYPLITLILMLTTHIVSGQMITTFAGGGTLGLGDGGPATAAEVNRPTGVAVDDVGNVYICEPLTNRVRKVGLDGNIATFAGTGIAGYSGDGGPAVAAQLSHPNCVATHGTDVYIGDSYHLDFKNWH